MDIQTLTHIAGYFGGGIAIGLGGIGTAIGEGYIAAEANFATSRNPRLSGDIFKSMLVGQALSESASIFALVITILLLFADASGSQLQSAGLLSAGVCMGLGALGSGLGAALPGAEGCIGIARQPESSSRLTTNMLIGSAICQTPAIFSMVVSLLLIFMDFSRAPLSPTWAALLSAGLCTGLAAIGSSYGSGLAARASCQGIARNPESAGNVTTTMLIGQAVTQTPSIFALLVSFILMFKSYPESDTLNAAMALLSSGICTGIGGIGPGIGNGLVAESAVKWVARNLEYANDLTKVMMVGQAVSQSTAIYAMVVSLVLIFVV